MFSVINSLKKTAFKYPKKIAVIHDNQKINFYQLNILSLNFSSNLISRGIKKNQKVGIFLNKSINTIIAIYGILRSGAVLVPILPKLKIDGLNYIVHNSDMKILITDKANFDYIKKIKIKKIILSEKILKPKKNIEEHIIGNDNAAIIYSSGSTGSPKGILISHKNLFDGAKIVSNYLKLKKNDGIGCLLSFNFDYGLNQLWSSVYNGSTLFLHNLIFLNDFYKFISNKKITILPLMPVMISKINELKNSIKFNNIKLICTSGGRVNKSMINKLKMNFPKAKIYLMYGLTEAFRSSYLDPKYLRQKYNSIGKAIPDVELYIMNKKGKFCKPNEIGELIHRGGCISKGYWKNKKITDQKFKEIPAFPGEKVLFTGDLAKKDKDGFIYFISRMDEMIKTHGFRVSPTEIEDVVNQIRELKHSVVFGKENLKIGQEICLAYNSDKNKNLEEKIRSVISKKLPSYMMPSKIIKFDKFPVTGNQGKLDRSNIIKRAKIV